MIFYNNSNQTVTLRIYLKTDFNYTFPKKKVKIKSNSQFTWEPPKNAEKIQVTFEVDKKEFGPKAVFTSKPVTFTADQYIVNGTGEAKIMDKIEHIVVVSLENRSFDNILGWLYSDQGNRPPRNIPAQNTPTYDGLLENTYWNSLTKSPDEKVFASKIKTEGKWYNLPNECPHEVFPYMMYQMFSEENPPADKVPDMSGFMQNYSTVENSVPSEIMQCFVPSQLPHISKFATDYAVCDRWFGSLPCETWPNRSFMHAGTSFGRLNNMDGKYNEGDKFPDVVPNNSSFIGQRTIFNVLEEQGVNWKIYSASRVAFQFPLARLQFFPAWDLVKIARIQPFYQPVNFLKFTSFLADAKAGKLPAYSFIEPEYAMGANDQHPNKGIDARKADNFLNEIVTALSNSPKWDRTLLIITYDEHGGCYDHVPPPTTATIPDDSKPQFETKMNPFTIYGPRVPTVLISPFIESGTVFRSGDPNVEYDHTAILATLREWIFGAVGGPSQGQWLASKRIEKAPTIWSVLTRDKPRTDRPTEGVKLKEPMLDAQPSFTEEELARPLDARQKYLVVYTEAMRRTEEQLGGQDGLIAVPKEKQTQLFEENCKEVSIEFCDCMQTQKDLFEYYGLIETQDEQ